MSDDLLGAALAFVGDGLPVFPCEPRGKRPLVEGGFKAATLDTEQIRTWWSKWRLGNIGIPTGEVSGFVVVDIDPGGDASLAALAGQHGPLPETRAVKTGRGKQLWFKHPGGSVRCSAGVLGQGLDFRGDGGYVIAPPSIHPNGQRYAFVNDHVIAEAPDWLVRLTSQAKAETNPTRDADGKIPSGKRNATLTAIAGSLRRQRLPESEICKTLLGINSRQCDPPLPDAEVARIAASVARYAPGGASSTSGERGRENPWESAEGMETFLASEDDPLECLHDRVVYRETVTELFSPRGLGKSLFLTGIAVSIAAKGYRVLLLDRDNSVRIVKTRLRGWGADPELKTIKAMGRDKCPPLTRPDLWASFPYAKYDVVLLDSFDAMAEGVGEQDSAKPSKALAPILDIARRENGPAVVVLGNCVRKGTHSRGSGVVEDRADICYEVRDATTLQPTGNKSWIEELPPADAGSWAGRAMRRKQRETYRLAFIHTKFRGDQEPEPFIVEIDLRTSPWTLRDVTDDVDRAGAAERERRAKERADALAGAVEALRAEITRREGAGEPGILKKQAETFLTGLGMTQKMARETVQSPAFEVVEQRGKGHPKVLRLVSMAGSLNRNAPILEGASIQGGNDTDFGCPDSMHPTEIDPHEPQYPCGSEKAAISVGDSRQTPPEREKEVGKQWRL